MLSTLALQRLALRGSSKPRIVRPSSGQVRSPRVSVVIPCYNYARFLPASVESALAQPGVDVDVLIVDDASTDGSGDLAEALAADHPRIRVHRSPTNRGNIATYNYGLAQVEGEYVFLLSADDMLTPGALSRAVRLMEANRQWASPMAGRSRSPTTRRRRRASERGAGWSGRARIGLRTI